MKDSILKKSFEQIIECTKICAKKIKKYNGTAILIEKILAIFLEELEIAKRIKKRKIKKGKRTRKRKYTRKNKILKKVR